MVKFGKFSTHALLITIIFISILFRFYNFKNLQVWTGDDEIITASIRHIVWDRSPSLLIPNSALGFGMGPYYFYILSVFYFLTSFNVVIVQVVASLLGVATTYVIYLCGKMLRDEKLGLLASFFYASSFLISLFDRRLWPLSPGPFLSALTFFGLLKVINKDIKYIPLLAIPIGFAFHSDLYLLVLVISIAVSWFVFRFPLKNKYTLLFIGILLVFVVPFVFAEIRYKGAVSGPVIKSISKPIQGVGFSPSQIYDEFSFSEFTNVFARTLFTAPSDYIESQWCHGHCNYPLPLFSPLPQVYLIVMVVISFWLTFVKKIYKNRGTSVSWIMLLSFVFGMLVFNRVFRANFNQLYFLVILPVFLILISQALLEVGKKAPRFLWASVLIYFFVNFYALINSSIKYPLYQKINLVKASLVDIKDNQFSLYASDNTDIQGGGWTELYNLQKKPAVKSYWYDFTNWLYAAYSLFPGPIQQEDPNTLVIIQKFGEGLESNKKVTVEYRYKDIELKVIDNSEYKKF